MNSRIIKSAKNFAEKTPHDIVLDNGKQINKGTVFNVDYDKNEQDGYVLGISVDGFGKTQLRFNSEDDAFKQGWIIESADKHFNYDEYLGDIYDSDERNADSWSREEYNEMVETARGIFYPAVQKAANACHFTVSDDEAEYVAEKCVRYFFDITSWEEAINRPEEYQVNSSREPIKSDYHDKEIYRQAFGALLEDYAPEGNYPGGYRVLVDGNYETEFSANSREEAIQKFKDYFANKKKGVNSSRQIKSSLEDRLVPYLEEFEEGYSNALVEDPMDSYAGFDTSNARCETFYETFKNDHNLTDDDINALENAVLDMWHETDAELGE